MMSNKLFNEIYDNQEFFKNNYINIINNNDIQFKCVKLSHITSPNYDYDVTELRFDDGSNKRLLIKHKTYADGSETILTNHNTEVDANKYTYEVVNKCKQQCNQEQGCTISGGRVSKKQSRKRKSYRKSYRKRAGRKTHSR